MPAIACMALNPKIRNMKYLLPLTVMVLFACATVNGQNNTSSKPALFSSFPEKIICADAELSRAFAADANQQASLKFSSNFSFNGTVLSNTVKYGNMQSIIIKSKDFADAVLSLTRITQPGGEVEYKGRIVNIKYSDGYELKKDAAGNYQLVKFETDKMLQDCKQ